MLGDCSWGPIPERNNPNFAEYATLCGALGLSVEKIEDLDDAIGTAIAHDGPSLVEIRSDAELV